MKKNISVIKSLFDERGRKVKCGLSEDQSSGTYSPPRESSVKRSWGVHRYPRAEKGKGESQLDLQELT